jgi:hypothetical protein
MLDSFVEGTIIPAQQQYRLALGFLAVSAAFAQTPAAPWDLANFAQRLEVEVSNPSTAPVEALASIPVSAAAQVAPRFPGTLAIAVLPGNAELEIPMQVAPAQADDLDGDGTPDELVFPVRLGAGETRTVYIYYSTALHDELPWPKRVHASHAYGYNRATVALESETIGYRTYGGFFLDIQARAAGSTGLHNSLVGYFGTIGPRLLGRDVIHLGDTLGLGGLYLRSGGRTFRPPLNMPDYAHKPEAAEAPHYRVISTGPLRAVVEARMDRWTLPDGAVSLRALYSIAAGSGTVECRFEIVPLALTGTFEVGAGIRHLPDMQLAHAAGRLGLSGTQDAKTGPIALALYYDAAEAAPAEAVVTKEGGNECIAFRQKLAPGQAVRGSYRVAGAWSGSGIANLTGYLADEDARTRTVIRVGAFRFAKTPQPERVEGEAH